jgi:Clp amino terminal domain, pathogenicity island component
LTLAVTALPDIEQLKAEIPPGTALGRLMAAAVLAEQLRARGDELLDHFVDAARAGGASWSEIGGCLRTTKQAAQQRFAVLADPEPGTAPFGLTGAGAAVLACAADAARELGHEYIRPEHLVLGLLAQPDELAARVLAEFGVTAEIARAKIEERLGRYAARPDGSLGVAPPTKRLLAQARAIAKSLDHKCPRTEHILLAATSPKLHGPAATLLAESGANPDDVRDQITRTLLKQAPELADRLNRKRSSIRFIGM